MPKGTPMETIARLNQEINGALANPTIKSRLAEIGHHSDRGSQYTSEQFQRLMADSGQEDKDMADQNEVKTKTIGW